MTLFSSSLLQKCFLWYWNRSNGPACLSYLEGEEQEAVIAFLLAGYHYDFSNSVQLSMPVTDRVQKRISTL